MGFDTLVVFTGHFGLDQTLATKRAALHTMRHSKATVLPLTTYDMVADFYAGDHAGIGETSLLMAVRPDLVRLDAWPLEEPLPGVIGSDPRAVANAALGHRIFDESARRAAKLVSGLRSGRFSRDEWIATLEIAVGILALTRTLRQTMPRDRVPAITTPDYLGAWLLIAEGRFLEAQTLLREKVATLELVSRVQP
jgi:hypothetical protein